MYEYEILESELIKKTNKIVLMFLLLGMPVMFGFTLIIFNISVRYALVICTIAFLYSWVVLIAKNLLCTKEPRKIKILIADDKIVRQYGKKEEFLLWKRIMKVKIVENKTGDPIRIKLYGDNKKVIYVYGFKEIMNIQGLIKGKISEGTLVRTKRWLLDWGNPFVLSSVCWPIICVVFYIIYLIGRILFNS